MVEIYERRIKRMEARVGGDVDEDVAEAKKGLKEAWGLLEKANKAIEDLEKFYEKVKWGKPDHRLHPLLPRHSLRRRSRRLH